MIRSLARQIANIGRAREIATVFARFGFGTIVARMGLGGHGKEGDVLPANAAQRFVKALQELGPTFVKLGQVLSTRPDILPAEWIKELGTLQDQVPPLSEEVARQALADGLPHPPEHYFARIDWKPIAAASIGQVHTARLLDGTEVVIKLLRPGIAPTIRADISILKSVAELAELTVPELKAFRPTGIIAEFERSILREVDFLREGRNAKRFAANFADRDDVIVPKIYDHCSSSSVLVMEKIDGVKVTDYEQVGSDPAKLARLGIEVVFKMAFEDGFFHADPHPGNIWAMSGDRLAVLDMGMADFVMPQTRDYLIDLLFAVISEDPEAIGEVVLQIADKPENIDLVAYRRDLYQIYEDNIRGLPLGQISVAEVVRGSFDAARKHNLVIPTDITMLLKGLATIEGVGKQLDPDLDIVDAAKPFVLRIISMRWGLDRLKKDGLGAAMQLYEFVLHLPRNMNSIMARVERGQFRIVNEVDGLQKAAEGLTRAQERIALALVILAIVGGSAVLAPIDPFRYQGHPLLTYAGLTLAAVLAAGALVSPMLQRLWNHR